MGLEIDREEFDEEAYRRFGARLARSLEVLEDLLARDGFGVGPATLGAELEVSLVDPAGRPLPLNSKVLGESVDPRLTVELDRFNLESNLQYSALRGRPFAALEAEMHGSLAEMTRAASIHGGQVAMIGILPTLTEADLQSDAMTDAMRYRALSASLRRLRQEPFLLDIHGEDPLALRCHDVTYEGAATSLQIHLRVDPGRFAAVYNAIQLATPAVLAVAGNSPTFLGHRLWDETRVALFKQAVDTRPATTRRHAPARVSFGEGWIQHPLELFTESVQCHPVLLPVLDTESPDSAVADGAAPGLRELRLHQGTIWRWNRAIYDPAGAGHLRVEMRVLPSGPTVEDMVANTAFHLGLALDLANELPEGVPAAAFDAVHADFYRAAREGLDAEIRPVSVAAGDDTPPVRASKQFEALLARAQRGLDGAGIEHADAAPRLATIERRVRRGLTGARWQRRALAEAERRRSRSDALQVMFARYRALSAEGSPVDGWPDPDA